MNYANEEIIGALKAAREAKGLSQRDLSAKIGVPQSHISKIESGGSDLKLSSLVELARALDLELALVPRKLMPAVDGIIRSVAVQGSAEARQKATVVNRAQTAVTKLARLHPEIADLERLAQTVRELANFQLDSAELTTIRNATDRLKKIQKGPQALSEIRRTTEQLRTLRNRIAHAVPEPPHPAYSLDQEDDDA
ncbi:helix-turn-helix transcriptional regulator [Methylocapsa sp. D3K7]|uniref:helix-turn-helix domain-containing protein n=1 Tax=Methylocapsa sp. D3K7 TaxID=3041435 RepID=UPI00244EDCDA|nr:helix-turn-helix transcriptional regulator [Methylocapsa sp. D3K7]WGJ13887.1 helix-turn-helix transcriptional regulator [Methylocapsa sp. D3K7]